MAGRLQGWRALSWADRWRLLAMMLFGLPAISACLRLRGYVRTRSWLERISTTDRRRAATRDDLDAALALANLASIAGRHGPFPATCLRQSLMIHWVLRRRGLSSELMIGVRKQDDKVDAHAWVELDGHALEPGEITHRSFPAH